MSVLNILLLLFLAGTIFETRIQTKTLANNKLQQKLSGKHLALFLLIGIICILAFISLGPKNVISWYIRISFSALVIGHGLWLSLNTTRLRKALIILSSVLIICYRLVFPSEISHNLFLFTALLWLGPFFTQVGLLTRKRFFLISIVWFIYDIVYVWLTPLAETIVTTTESVGFPLAFVWGEQFIGTADFLWAGCLLSILRKHYFRLAALGILIASHVVLEIVANSLVEISLFPLLVLWVPFGMVLLFFERRIK